jgi:ubiquinone biosynthesis protein UbiJ
MPAESLFIAGVEGAINQLLKLDPTSPSRLSQLQGKRLAVFITELNQGVILVFSDQLDLLHSQLSHGDYIKTMDEDTCCMRASLGVLGQLRDSSKLTGLIRENLVSLDGDIEIAQQVSRVFQQLDIDWEEILAQHTNDVFAHQLFKSLGAVKQQVNNQVARFSRLLGDGLTEEKQLAAHKLAVMHFGDEVERLQDDVARTHARLERLEGLYKGENT